MIFKITVMTQISNSNSNNNKDNNYDKINTEIN